MVVTPSVFVCGAQQTHKCRPVFPLIVAGMTMLVCVEGLEWWLGTGLVQVDTDPTRRRVARREA